MPSLAKGACRGGGASSGAGALEDGIHANKNLRGGVGAERVGEVQAALPMHGRVCACLGDRHGATTAHAKDAKVLARHTSRQQACLQAQFLRGRRPRPPAATRMPGSITFFSFFFCASIAAAAFLRASSSLAMRCSRSCFDSLGVSLRKSSRSSSSYIREFVRVTRYPTKGKEGRKKVTWRATHALSNVTNTLYSTVAAFLCILGSSATHTHSAYWCRIDNAKAKS